MQEQECKLLFPVDDFERNKVCSHGIPCPSCINGGTLLYEYKEGNTKKLLIEIPERVYKFDKGILLEPIEPLVFNSGFAEAFKYQEQKSLTTHRHTALEYIEYIKDGEWSGYYQMKDASGVTHVWDNLAGKRMSATLTLSCDYMYDDSGGPGGFWVAWYLRVHEIKSAHFI
jgi:hypothetical protein